MTDVSEVSKVSEVGFYANGGGAASASMSSKDITTGNGQDLIGKIAQVEGQAGKIVSIRPTEENKEALRCIISLKAAIKGIVSSVSQSEESLVSKPNNDQMSPKPDTSEIGSTFSL